MAKTVTLTLTTEEFQKLAEVLEGARFEAQRHADVPGMGIFWKQDAKALTALCKAVKKQGEGH